MIKIFKESSRGRGNYGWLKANYSFSFSRYFNPQRMGFNSLRVINEDFIAPKAGFPVHSHQNMEILTLVLKGKLGHTDSLGNVQELYPGRIQRMYAGSGISHSEFNASKEEELNLLQIWVEPNVLNLPPEYKEKSFDLSKKYNLLASSEGRDGSIKIYQEMELFLINLKPNENMSLDLKSNEEIYLHNISGHNLINGMDLNYGDSAEISKISHLSMTSAHGGQVLGFKFFK